MILYNPIHPGEFLKNQLERLNGSAEKFAAHIQVAEHQITDLLSGQTSIDADMAIRLEQALDISAQHWMEMQIAFDLKQAKDAIHENEPEIEQLSRMPKQSKKQRLQDIEQRLDTIEQILKNIDHWQRGIQRLRGDIRKLLMAEDEQLAIIRDQMFQCAVTRFMETEGISREDAEARVKAALDAPARFHIPTLDELESPLALPKENQR